MAEEQNGKSTRERRDTASLEREKRHKNQDDIKEEKRIGRRDTASLEREKRSRSRTKDKGIKKKSDRRK